MRPEDRLRGEIPTGDDEDTDQVQPQAPVTRADLEAVAASWAQRFSGLAGQVTKLDAIGESNKAAIEQLRQDLTAAEEAIAELQVKVRGALDAPP